MGHVFVVVFNVVVVRLIVTQRTQSYPITFHVSSWEQTGNHGRRGRRGLKGEPGIPGLDGREGVVDCKVLVLYLFLWLTSQILISCTEIAKFIFCYKALKFRATSVLNIFTKVFKKNSKITTRLLSLINYLNIFKSIKMTKFHITWSI